MILVGKTGVKYAAVAGTANAALLPTQLDAGSIGIYGRDKNGLKDVLIIQGASATGKVQASLFKGKTIKICEGLGGGKFKTSEYVDIAGIDLNASTASAYAAPVAWKGYVGYNDVTLAGNIAAPTSTLARNAIDIKVEEISTIVAGDKFYPRYYSVVVAAGTAGATYDGVIADAIVAEINKVVAGFTNDFTASKITSGSLTGVKLVATDTIKQYNISIMGDAIENATVSKVEGSTGSGTELKMLAEEKKSNAYRGDFYTASAIDKHVVSSIVGGGTYDVYKLASINTEVPGGFGGAGLAGNAKVQSSVEVTIIFAQPNDDTAGNNQQEFVEIMIDIVPNIYADIVETAV